MRDELIFGTVQPFASIFVYKCEGVKEMRCYKALRTLLIVVMIGVVSLSMMGNIVVNANEQDNVKKRFLHLDADVKVVGVYEDSVSVKVTIYLENQGYMPVDLMFNTSQKFDFSIKNDKFSYYYGKDKMFLQVIVPLTIRPGEKIELGTDVVKVPYGTYDFYAYLACDRDIDLDGVIVLRRGDVQVADSVLMLYKDIYSSLAIVSDVKYYIVSSKGTVDIDFYIVNRSSSTLTVSDFSMGLSVISARGPYLSYISDYDEGQYLSVITGTLTLAPGERQLVATFRWDGVANVRDGKGYDMQGEQKYVPYYIVSMVNEAFRVTVSSVVVDVPRGLYRLVIPMYHVDDFKFVDIPDWLKTYIDEVGVKVVNEFLLPVYNKGVIFSQYGTRQQVLWGVFRLSYLEPTAVTSPVFTDVDVSHFMVSVLATLKESGVVKGYPDGTVGLGREVTRAEAVTFMIRYLENVHGIGFDNMKRRCKEFSDIKGNEWYAKYVCYAQWVGIVDGYPDGTFRPMELVTVAELTKMLGALYTYVKSGSNH